MNRKVALIGNTFLDYKGWPLADKYDPVGRNIGKVEISQGGVGRNVAENIATLNVETHFVSIFDKNSIGDMVKSHLETVGVKLDLSEDVSSGGIGMWLAILSKKGELLGSISNLPDITLLEEFVEQRIDKIVQDFNHIVLDIDLSEKISQLTMEKARANNCRVYALPSNLAVLGTNKDLLKGIFCFVCNDIEAEKLLEQEIKTIEQAQEACRFFCHNYGVQNMVITLGEKGSVFANTIGEYGHQGIAKTAVVDTTGAGDAFFSATVATLVRVESLTKAVDIATQLAAMVISCKQNTYFTFKEQIMKTANFSWFYK